MWFLPYERLTIKTNLSQEEALKKLTDIVDLRPWYMQKWSNKPYRGTINGSGFSISRRIDHRNSFSAAIVGEIQPDLNGCLIELTMSPHKSVTLFMAFWLGGVLLMLLFMLSVYIFGGHHGDPTHEISVDELLPVIGLFVFGCGMFLSFFKLDSCKSKTFFCEFFQAYEVFEFGKPSKLLDSISGSSEQ
jgi:hypothetical protein